MMADFPPQPSNPAEWQQYADSEALASIPLRKSDPDDSAVSNRVLRTRRQPVLQLRAHFIDHSKLSWCLHWRYCPSVKGSKATLRLRGRGRVDGDRNCNFAPCQRHHADYHEGPHGRCPHASKNQPTSFWPVYDLDLRICDRPAGVSLFFFPLRPAPTSLIPRTGDRKCRGFHDRLRRWDYHGQVPDGLPQRLAPGPHG